MSYSRRAVAALTLLLFPFHGVWAGNYGESVAWQFHTSADKVNMAIIQDMIQKKKNGYYAPSQFITNIERQYNCNVTASSIGNNGTNSTIANSPSTSGASSNATGNDNDTDVNGGTSPGVTGNQDNSGEVESHVHGGTSTRVHGHADQVLNSTQTNSGNQTANVSDSTACAFGALN